MADEKKEGAQLAETIAGEAKESQTALVTADKAAQNELDTNFKANDKGVLIASNLKQQKELAKYLIKSKLVPASLDSPEKVLVAMQYLYSLGLNPFVSMRQVYVINGTPSIYGDLPLAIVKRSGKLVSFEEYYVDKDYLQISVVNKNLDAEIFAAVCLIQMQGMEKPVEVFFTRKMAEAAGLLKRADSTWTKYFGDMLKYRARSRALKDYAADLLNGAAILEYDFNTMPGFDSPGTEGKTKPIRKDIKSRYMSMKQERDVTPGDETTGDTEKQEDGR